MANDLDMAVDLNDPYMLKPLFLTELAFAESDSEEEDEEDPQQPFPRSGHRIVCIGNHSVYAFGGYNPDMPNGQSRLFGEMWQFDLNNYRWTQVLGPNDPGMPPELASMSMCASGKFILVTPRIYYAISEMVNSIPFISDIRWLRSSLWPQQFE